MTKMLAKPKKPGSTYLFGPLSAPLATLLLVNHRRDGSVLLAVSLCGSPTVKRKNVGFAEQRCLKFDATNVGNTHVLHVLPTLSRCLNWASMMVLGEVFVVPATAG